MADFYNLADQKLFKDYQFLPQEKYRLGLNLPTDATENEVVTDQGIVNTNAFANAGGGGDFNPAGNMFGEGTAVSPVYGNTYIDTVRREGPESRQAVEALINAGGTYPAGLQSAEGGFEYTSDFGNNLDYSKSAFDSLESDDERAGFLSKMFNKAGQIKSKLPSWAQAGITALNPFSIIPNLLSGIGGDGPKYGIAGLTDQQKNLYDSLASQGMLFNTPSGMKTFDGKNFSQFDQESIDSYFDNKIDKFGSIEEYEDYLDEEPDLRKNLIKTLDFYKQAQKTNDDYEDLNSNTITDDTITDNMINEFIFENNKDGGTTTDNNTTDNTGTVSTTSPDYTPVGPNQPDPGNNNNNNDGGSNDNTGGDPGSEGAGDTFGNRSGRGRTGYFYGGKV
jgi:hypothetical protein